MSCLTCKSGVQTDRGSNGDRETDELMDKSGVELERGSNDGRETNGVIVPAGLTSNMNFNRWREQGGELLPGMLDDIVLKQISTKLSWRDVHVLSSVSPGWQQALQGWREQSGELLPRMLDDIVVKHISTKLSWRDVHVLSSVSPGWQQAVQRGKVYHSRVDSYSTETLAVIPRRLVHGKYGLEETVSFSLYSLRDKYSYELPSSQFGMGWTFVPKCLSLDRKIYVLGTTTPHPIAKTWLELVEKPNPNVYVLDLGEKQWKQCASMNEPRRDKFAVAALNGKIYVFGGVRHRVVNGANFRYLLSTCEMYDPKIDAWSFIKPMLLNRWNHKIVTIEDELFVYGGLCRNSILGANKYATFLDVYHPVKDDWRRIVPSGKWDGVFTARGKFLRMFPRGIEVYDIENDSWSLLHIFQVGPYWRYYTVAFDDELLIGDGSTCRGRPTGDIFQSKGFGNKNSAITWEKLHKRSCSLDTWIPIQL